MSRNNKIYFSGAIRGGRSDVDYYANIIAKLNNHGEVLTGFIGDKTLDPVSGEGKSDSFIWRRDVDWVREAAVVVAEVTQPSLGVGYEIAIAHEAEVPVLALYRTSANSGRLSAMIAGDPNVTVAEYSHPADVTPIIDNFFHSLNQNSSK